MRGRAAPPHRGIYRVPPPPRELMEAYGRSVLNTRLGPQRLSTGIYHLPHRTHICPLGENYCLKFPSYDTRSSMLSRKFPELREHSIQELDDTDLNWLWKTKLVVLFSDSAAWYSPISSVLMGHAFSYLKVCWLLSWFYDGSRQHTTSYESGIIFQKRLFCCKIKLINCKIKLYIKLQFKNLISMCMWSSRRKS